LLCVRALTANCKPASPWTDFGSEVAIKRFCKENFYDKLKDEFLHLSEEKQDEECEKLCKRAFDKECEMLSRLVNKQNL
jgi:hypothetical protein